MAQQVFRTEQERIDTLTMRIENPHVVGSGYIQFPPQKKFEKPLFFQPPTVAHLEYPEEFPAFAQPQTQPRPQPQQYRPPPSAAAVRPVAQAPPQFTNQSQHQGGRGPPHGYNARPQAPSMVSNPSPSAMYSGPRHPHSPSANARYGYQGPPNQQAKGNGYSGPRDGPPAHRPEAQRPANAPAYGVARPPMQMGGPRPQGAAPQMNMSGPRPTAPPPQSARPGGRGGYQGPGHSGGRGYDQQSRQNMSQGYPPNARPISAAQAQRPPSQQVNRPGPTNQSSSSAEIAAAVTRAMTESLSKVTVEDKDLDDEEDDDETGDTSGMTKAQKKRLRKKIREGKKATK